MCVYNIYYIASHLDWEYVFNLTLWKNRNMMSIFLT